MAELAQTHYEMGYLHSPRGSGAAAGEGLSAAHTKTIPHTPWYDFKSPKATPDLTHN